MLELHLVQVFIRPQSESLIHFQLTRNDGLEFALVYGDGDDTFTLAFFRIQRGVITCSCLKTFCMTDPAFIEISCGDYCWRTKKSIFGQHSDYFQITTTIDRYRNMERLYRCELVLRHGNSKKSLYKWLWGGTGIVLIVIYHSGNCLCSCEEKVKIPGKFSGVTTCQEAVGA